MQTDGEYYSEFETLKECEIKILSEQEAKRVHEYYGDKLKSLEEWARGLKEDAQLSGREVTHTAFNCLANGHACAFDGTNYAGQLNGVKHQLESEHKKVLELRAEIKHLKGNIKE